jgi:dihydroorotate dehydrogenase (fumarate)
MNLSTEYLGFALPHPFMAGASPLVDDLGLVRRLEDAGAAAIVMRSLYEEQLTGEQMATLHYLEHPALSFAEAASYLPRPAAFSLGPDEYLEQLRKVRQAVAIPVIGSLNGVTPGGWVSCARLIEQAGASAIELNLYGLPTDPANDAWTVERQAVDLVREVVEQVKIPVAVKLSPFYSALANFARQLDATGARGLVLFNRFFQADIDPEALEVRHQLRLSDSSGLTLRLRWLAIISGRVKASLAVTGGVHEPTDAIKAVMAGAHAVQMVSALLRHGPERLKAVREGVARWLEEHEYESLSQMRGSMSLLRCPDPRTFERLHYIQTLQSWQDFI